MTMEDMAAAAMDLGGDVSCDCCSCGVLAEGRVVAVAFAVEADIGPEEEMLLVGASEELGTWRPGCGVRLHMSGGPYPTFFAVVHLMADSLVEYKFVRVRRDGEVHWEPGQNRQLHVVADGHGWVVARFGGDATPAPQRPLSDPGCIVTWEAECFLTNLGDSLLVVGECPELGAWDPAYGVELKTEPALWPLWRGVSIVLADELADEAPTTWKLAIRRATGEVEWEPEARVAMLPESSTLHKVQVVRAYCTLRATYGVVHAARCEEAAGRGGQTGSEIPREISFTSTCSTDDTARSITIDTPDGQDSPRSQLEFGRWLYCGAHRIGKAGGPCEDAYFTGPFGMGVADGVGSMIQFERYGVDCAAYATELMENAADYFQTAPRDSADGASVHASNAMATAESRATTFGAATMAVLQLHNLELGAAVLGDSGFMVLRQGAAGLEIIARSKEQQHGFNFPYQLMKLPPALLAKTKKDWKSDSAADCKIYSMPVQPGDLVLAFSDGFVDNLEDSAILRIVDEFLGNACSNACPRLHHGIDRWSCELDVNPSLLAEELCLAAHAQSINPDVEVPFGVTARAHGYKHVGGKQDDITVAAAWVVEI